MLLQDEKSGVPFSVIVNIRAVAVHVFGFFGTAVLVWYKCNLTHDTKTNQILVPAITKLYLGTLRVSRAAKVEKKRWTEP